MLGLLSRGGYVNEAVLSCSHEGRVSPPASYRLAEGTFRSASNLVHNAV